MRVLIYCRQERGIEMSEQGKELVIVLEDYETKPGVLPDHDAGKEAHVRYPLYFGCYQSALTSIFENIERLAGKRKQYLESESSEKDKYIDFSDMANNIIAFCGGRGSGKTTAIRDFQRILKNFGRQNEKRWWIQELSELVNLQKYENREIWFTVLDSVDASLLIEKEDIIELVLAQMYDMVENTMHRMHYDTNKKLIAEFVGSFEMVYKNYHQLRRGESGELGDSAAVILKNMSSGSKIRKAFSELLDRFFKLMYPEGEAEQYLVVTIDDLDLNIKHGYEMLEQIHKYLSDYRIIVLTAVDFEQLSGVCELYFNRQYDVKHSGQSGNIEVLVRDYLLKAIPVSNRIYMLDKRNFIGKAKIIQSNGEREFIKDFIMKKLSRKLGIYYDIKDIRRHFSIPMTVRELVSYNDFLDSLYTLNLDTGNQEKIDMAVYDYNHTRMNRDITERMAAQCLTGKYKKDFDSIVEANVLNRPKHTVDLCNSRLSGQRQDDRKKAGDSDIYHYSNLFKTLDEMEGEENNGFKDCILAFFTSEMTREYYSFRYNEFQKGKRSEDRLRRLLGASFGNEWLGRIMPYVWVEKEKGISINTGYMKTVNINAYKIPVSLYENGITKVPLIDEVLQSIKRDRIIEMLGCIILCCSNSDESGTSNFVPKITFEVKRSETGYECSIFIDATAASFDLFGFIGRTWSVKEKEQLTNNIIIGIQQGIDDFWESDDKPTNIGVWKDEAWEKLVETQMMDWFKSNFSAFPFYQVDLAYNVLKRARNSAISEEKNFDIKNVYTAIQKGYGYVAAELYRESLQYNKRRSKEDFYSKFVESPYIKKFGIIYSDETSIKFGLKSHPGSLPKKFGKVLGDMIKAMTIPIMVANDTLQ